MCTQTVLHSFVFTSVFIRSLSCAAVQRASRAHTPTTAREKRFCYVLRLFFLLLFLLLLLTLTLFYSHSTESRGRGYAAVLKYAPCQLQRCIFDGS